MRTIKTNPVLLMALVTTAGCHKTVTYLHVPDNAFAVTAKGEILEWRLFPPSSGITSFDVNFVGADPCRPHPKPLHGSATTPARCTVAGTKKGKTPPIYQYSVTYHSDKQAIFAVVPCNNCKIVESPGATKDVLAQQPASASKDSSTTARESAVRSFYDSHELSVSSGTVYFMCLDGKTPVIQDSTTQSSTTIISDPAAPTPTDIAWLYVGATQPSWIVRFDSSSPCQGSGGTPLLSFGSEAVDTCKVIPNLTPASYMYSVELTGCTNTATGVVKVPEPLPHALPEPK